MLKEIKGFFVEYAFLSNFYPSKIVFQDIEYPTVENAFQAMKTHDIEERKMIAVLSPGLAKKAGRSVKLREDWEQIKDTVMEFFLRLKFNKEPLRKKLFDTYPAYLEETNTWGDKYWGVCNEIGENKLGQLLMKIREEIYKIDKVYYTALCNCNQVAEGRPDYVR